MLAVTEHYYILCCSHVKGRVFAALCNGSAALFSRLAGVYNRLF